MDDELRETFDTQIDPIERRIEDGIAQVETLADKANLLRSMPPPGIGPVSAAVLIAELPELGRMTSGEAAAMIGFAPVPHDSGAMRGGERLRAGDGRYGMFCSKRHSPPPATTQFSSQSPSVSRSAGNYTDSSLS